MAQYCYVPSTIYYFCPLQDSNSYYLVVYYNNYINQWQKSWISPKAAYGNHVEFSTKLLPAGTTISSWLVVNAANNQVGEQVSTMVINFPKLLQRFRAPLILYNLSQPTPPPPLS